MGKFNTPKKYASEGLTYEIEGKFDISKDNLDKMKHLLQKGVKINDLTITNKIIKHRHYKYFDTETKKLEKNKIRLSVRDRKNDLFVTLKLPSSINKEASMEFNSKLNGKATLTNVTHLQALESLKRNKDIQDFISLSETTHGVLFNLENIDADSIKAFFFEVNSVRVYFQNKKKETIEVAIDEVLENDAIKFCEVEVESTTDYATTEELIIFLRERFELKPLKSSSKFKRFISTI